MTEGIKRIAYFDIMRGIAMTLIVCLHSWQTYLQITYQSKVSGITSAMGGGLSDIYNITLKICMPLFFFISGFFVYSKYDWHLLAKRSKNRLLGQLYPTIILWAFYCLLYENVQFDLLLNSYKQGYWFTLVVVEMFFLIAPLITLMYIKGVSQIHQNIILILYVVILEIVLQRMVFIHSYTWTKIISGELIYYYLPFFLMGILYKLNIENLKPILINKYIALMAVAAFAYITKEKDKMINEYGVNGLYIFFATGTLGIVFVHYLIYKLSTIKIVTSLKICTFFIYIGKMTLEIYLLHYFFIREVLRRILQHCSLFTQPPNPILDYILYLSNGVLIVGACIAAVYILKRIRLYQLLFPVVR